MSAFDFSTQSDTDAVLALELSDTTDRIFALVPAASQYDGRVAILDKTNGSTLLAPSVDFDYANFMALSPDGSALFLGVDGLSPSAFRRYTTTGDVITQTHSLSAGSNGQNLIVSPDGQHVAFFCGGGNDGLDELYSIADYSASDLSILGAWDLGSYPRQGTFSPDSNTFYTIRDADDSTFAGDVYRFSATTYVQSGTTRIPMYDSDTLMEASADGSAVVVYTQYYDGTKNRLWFVTF